MLAKQHHKFIVRIVPVLKDNYSYVIRCEETNTAAVVDVSQAKPVLETVKDLSVADFSTVLTTHKHWDHCGGNKEIVEKLQSDSLKIYGGANEQIPHRTNAVSEGDAFKIGNLNVSVLDTPCHTSGHVVYHVSHPEDPENGAVFTGDTMFVGGIGAFFEGDAQQMVTALDKITSLPDGTCVYPGHEYTLGFLKFSAKVDPSDTFIKSKLAEFEELRIQKKPTIPSTIGEEKKFNMFARTQDPVLQRLTGISDRVKLMEHFYNTCE